MIKRLALALLCAWIFIALYLIDYLFTGGILLALLFFTLEIGCAVEKKRKIKSPHLDETALREEDITKAAMEAHLGPLIIETSHLFAEVSSTGHLTFSPFFFYLCLVSIASVVARLRELLFWNKYGPHIIHTREMELIEKLTAKGVPRMEAVQCALGLRSISSIKPLLRQKDSEQ